MNASARQRKAKEFLRDFNRTIPKEEQMAHGLTNMGLIGGTTVLGFADLFGGDGENTGFLTGETPTNFVLGGLPLLGGTAAALGGYAIKPSQASVDKAVADSKQGLKARAREVGVEKATAEFANAKNKAIEDALRTRNKRALYAGNIGTLLGAITAATMMMDQ